MKQRNPRLLVVEDNIDDEGLILRALKRMDCDIDVEVVHDGEAAIDRLCVTGEQLPLPDLVVLDWKLPRVMGADVLERVRRTARCRAVTVVAFSSSDDPGDKEQCRKLGGNSYVVKPVDYASFMSAVQSIVQAYTSCGSSVSLSNSGNILSASI